MIKVQNRSNFSANNSQHFFCYVIAVEAWRNNVGFVCTALPTLLGSRTLITHGLQRLMGCILPMMHCRSQHYWELLHPFTHHRQHERNNSQCCWRNNVGSCCICLPTALVTSVKWYWYPCSGRFCAPQQTQWITGFALDFPSTSLANRQWDIKQTNHGTYSNPGK